MNFINPRNCFVCGCEEFTEALQVELKADTYIAHNKFAASNDALTRATYYKCNDCGSMMKNLVLTDGEKRQLYKGFRDEALRGETQDDYIDRIMGLADAESENHFRITNYLAPVIPNRGSIVDIGCGLGVFLAKFSSMFTEYECTGIDATSFSSSNPNFSKIQFINTFIDSNTPLEDLGRYNVITINHVLEHVEDPQDLLKNCLRLGNPDRFFVYVEVPSTADVGILKADHDRFMVQHERIFSPLGLEFMLKQLQPHSLSIKQFTSIRGRQNIAALAKFQRP